MLAFWVAIPTLNSGCLVTQDIEFRSQEDVPPSFVFRPRSDPPIGGTLVVDTDALSGQSITNLTFTLQVRDENVLQPLQTQIRLRTLESPTFSELAIIDTEDGSEIPGTGAAVRDFEFSLSTTVLKDLHCHQLELAVSGEFLDTGEDRVFALADPISDVAIATWWLWEISPGTPVNLATCPTNPFR